MLSKKLKKIKFIFLTVGVGSGSKYLQSFFDNHKQIFMMPGYTLMYLWPHWKNWIKNEKEKKIQWNYLVDNLLKFHPSIIDSKKIPGSSDINSLGKTGKQSIKIDKKKFRKTILMFLENEKISFKTFLIAIHCSYSQLNKENIKDKKLIFYHIHSPEYTSEIIKKFPNSIVISMARELKSNISNRLKSSLEKINSIYLNNTDIFLFHSRSYKNIIMFYLQSYLFFKKIGFNRNFIVKHEDLIERKKGLLRNMTKILNIKFTHTILKSTMGGKEWKNKFYNLTLNKNGEKISILKFNKKNYFFYELFWIEGVFYNFYKSLGYKTQYFKNNLFNKLLIFPLIMLPSKYELKVFFNSIYFKNILNYCKNILFEISFPQKLKNYEKIAFYKHKWSNKMFPFSVINFLIKKNKLHKTGILYKAVYTIFKLLQLMFNPFSVVFNYLLRCFFTFYFHMLNLVNPIRVPNKL